MSPQELNLIVTEFGQASFMTFIEKKKAHNYKDNIKDWKEVFRLQKVLLSNF
jgi:hypothetical protein